MTIEDPIEVLHADKASIVNQREVGTDTADFHAALKRVLRQDPDVILVGEMRDPETVRTALDRGRDRSPRVLDAAHDQRDRLDQPHHRLLPAARAAAGAHVARRRRCAASSASASSSGAAAAGSPAVEVLVATGRVFDKIVNADETHEIEEIIAEGEFYGMQTFDQSLLEPLRRGRRSSCARRSPRRRARTTCA